MGFGARITGWGSAVPDTVVTNAEFEGRLATSDEWITERTGIKERRWGGTTSSLSIEAGNAAIKRAGLSAADIDLLILSTTTPDQAVPATSAVVSHKIGTSGGAFDLNAACAGYVYAMVVGRAMIGAGVNKKVLVLVADTLSRITDMDDRGTAILFADGAGGVVLEATEDQDDFLGWDLGVDGSAQPILYADHGSYLRMEGREVYKKAVRVMVESAEIAMHRAGVTSDDIALCVPHQANIRIIEAACNRLSIPMERASVVLDRFGNTSSGSIPLALVDAEEKNRLNPGDLVLFSGFGAGMTWASAVVRWSGN